MHETDRNNRYIHTEEKRDEETESLRSSIRQRTKDRQVRTTRICLAWEKDRIRSSEAELTKVRLARERESEGNSSVHYGKKKEKESRWTIDNERGKTRRRVRGRRRIFLREMKIARDTRTQRESR